MSHQITLKAHKSVGLSFSYGWGLYKGETFNWLTIPQQWRENGFDIKTTLLYVRLWHRLQLCLLLAMLISKSIQIQRGEEKEHSWKLDIIENTATPTSAKDSWVFDFHYCTPVHANLCPANKATFLWAHPNAACVIMLTAQTIFNSSGSYSPALIILVCIAGGLRVSVSDKQAVGLGRVKLHAETVFNSAALVRPLCCFLSPVFQTAERWCGCF